ncbi:MAG: 2-octaprenyl-6-methoxyphenyl hydroxylase [Halomonadaceae bacterium]|nr:MAG: 2-octaprenyl-6-methoxyphenyl hydroxylase [Halomonadaceae bacterium]
MNTAENDVDIIIAGGGMAGSSLALGLIRQVPTLSVAVVEATTIAPSNLDTDTYQPSYDARATALGYGSRLIFEDLGVWPQLRSQATPIQHIHVSEKGKPGRTGMHASEHQQGGLGYVVDNQWLGRCLLQALQGTPVNWLAPGKVISARRENDRTHLEVDLNGDMQQWSCGLLVVADGGRSGLREALDFKVDTQDYEQHAIIANISTSNPHHGTAFERFTPEGPVALLPRGGSDGRDCGLVWTHRSEQAQELLEMPEDEFLGKLQKVFGWRLGRFVNLGRRDSYPLTLTRVAQPARPGMLLVGNAAHTLHPVAGQGFNLALRGLMRLAEQIRLAHAAGNSPGAMSTLQAYLDEHQPDEDAIVGFSDSMVRLFNEGPPMINGARDLGLVTLDLINPAKYWFARQAMGLGRRRSSLGAADSTTQAH